MTTSPLRSDTTQRSSLGRWLRVQADAIAAPWIGALQMPRGYGEHPAEPAIANEMFTELYEALATALETGRYGPLDSSISVITHTGRDRGYQLNDLLSIVTTLKSEIWQAVVAAYPAEEALGHLRSIDVLFQTALSYQARVFTELTQKELANELSKTQQQLNKLDQTKSRFISIAAHELKTPLTLIQGYSDMLSRELSNTASEQVRNVLNGLDGGARRLLATVNDMIAVSMIDIQALTLNHQIVSLPHVLQIVLNDLRSNIDERQLHFKFEPAPAALQPFYADPQRLYQVLGYVISNSIKYTPDNGTITIGIYLLPAIEDVDRYVEVRVIDTGIGIDPEDLPHIFDKFYGKTDISRHSSSRTKFKGGGTGLGLAVVRGIVEAHGGKVVIESPGYDEEKCPGTTVRILLPVRYQPPPSSSDKLSMYEGTSNAS